MDGGATVSLMGYREPVAASSGGTRRTGVPFGAPESRKRVAGVDVAHDREAKRARSPPCPSEVPPSSWSPEESESSPDPVVTLY